MRDGNHNSRITRLRERMRDRRLRRVWRRERRKHGVNLNQASARAEAGDDARGRGDERDAVKDGATAVQRLIERLAGVPSAIGLTPQLSWSGTLIPLADLDVCATKG